MTPQDLQTLTPQELQDMQRALDEQQDENRARRRMVRDELIRRGPLAPDTRPAPPPAPEAPQRGLRGAGRFLRGLFSR